MSGLAVITLLLALTTPISLNVHAQGPTHKLFAVDLSLSAEQRNTAYDVIQEITLTAPGTQTIGLTLFDDTVRRFVAPATLDSKQIGAINNTLTESLDSVHSSSNLAVGIERAIDNLQLTEPANLIVFSRGVIDTPTQDPRARFSEWLELILLPQAAEENISIILVIPQDQTTDPAIKQAFESIGSHSIVTFTAGERMSPVLVSLLGIADRPYGELDTIRSPDTELPETPTPQNQDKPAVEIANEAATESRDLWLTAKLVLLAIATILLCAIVYWRYRAKKALSRQSTTTIRSSTYLPLTEKPSDTMDSWLKDDSDAPHSDLPANKSPSEPQITHQSSPEKRSNSKPAKSKQKEQEPWD